jgi:hypothetical protein
VSNLSIREREMTSTHTYTPLIENNDHEGETWTWWIRVEGNEGVLDLINDTILAARDVSEYFEEYDLPEWPNGDRITDEQLAVLLRWSDGGYYRAHNPVYGRLVLPNDFFDPEFGIFERHESLYTGGLDDWDRGCSSGTSRTTGTGNPTGP